MERLSQTGLQHARTILDQVNLYEVKIKAYTSRNRLSEAVTMAREALKLLGITFPEHPTTAHVIAALLKTKAALIGKRIETLVALPKMTDPHKLAAMRIFLKISAPAYLTNPNLVPLTMGKELRVSLIYGNSAMTANTYAAYGFLLCGFVGDIATGYRFGNLALAVQERFNDRVFAAATICAVNAYIRPWKEHLRNTLAPLLEAYHIGLETGEFIFGSVALTGYGMYAFYAGKNLSELEGELAGYSKAIGQMNQETTQHYLNIIWQVVLNLSGAETGSATSLTGRAYDETVMLPFHRAANDRLALFSAHFVKQVLCYFFGEYTQALNYANTAERDVTSTFGSVTVTQFYLYDSLVRLAVLPDFSTSGQRRMLRKVAANQKKMKKWAKHAPMNFLHKWQLVEAERARVRGKYLMAEEYYDKAIAGAKEHQYLQEEALANELTARFQLGRGHPQIARTYLQEARYCYLRWGAQAKVQQLDAAYLHLLEQSRRPAERTATTMHTTTSTTTTGSSLDLTTAMKASQTIAGEIVLETLLTNMMRIVIENAGAQRGLLILETLGKWAIEAEVELEGQAVQVLQTRPLADNVPESLIQYVIRSQEAVIACNIFQEEQFSHDPYILAHQPKAVLCLPLLNQGQLIGLLYLENNLTSGAFTPERVELLKLLSSQMAVSIENARLYRHQVELTKGYSRFVPKEFLRLLEKTSVLDVELGDQIEREMTILFSDIRGFTTLSEGMTPQENFNFINSYLSRMEPCIHHYHGFIDKYIGDAIMALFPTQADDALNAAITMLRTLVTYNQGRQQAGYPPIRIGIGLNTGTLMLGTVGGQDRMDGTVISDAVNLASRLEGLTKIYGAAIVISEQTRARLRDTSAYHLRFLGKVQVKGKTEPVAIFEIYDADPPELKALKQQTAPELKDGLQRYYAQEFTEAERCFKHILSLNPDDKTAALYLQRSAQYRRHGVPEDWDGVESLDHK